MSSDVRPSVGQITHADGTITPVTFAPTADDPTVFELIDLDGHPVKIRATDRVHVDVIGPAQSVALYLDEGEPWPTGT